MIDGIRRPSRFSILELEWSCERIRCAVERDSTITQEQRLELLQALDYPSIFFDFFNLTKDLRGVLSRCNDPVMTGFAAMVSMEWDLGKCCMEAGYARLRGMTSNRDQKIALIDIEEGFEEQLLNQFSATRDLRVALNGFADVQNRKIILATDPNEPHKYVMNCVQSAFPGEAPYLLKLVVDKGADPAELKIKIRRQRSSHSQPESLWGRSIRDLAIQFRRINFGVRLDNDVVMFEPLKVSSPDFNTVPAPAETPQPAESDPPWDQAVQLSEGRLEAGAALLLQGDTIAGFRR